MDKRPVQCYAVFGNPVLHSRSPQLYNILFESDRINACYTRIHAPTGQAVCELIRILGLTGANITTPFKEALIPYLDRLSPDAEKISAVNTVTSRNGELTGYNTDAYGITGSLKEAGINPSGMKCMVMGAGGAGKAAATGLLNAGADVLITNRTPGKALEFARKSGCRFAPIGEAVKTLKSYDVLVITLPPGIFPFAPENIHAGLIMADANYRSPSGTGGIDEFRCRIVKGDRWLLHQAVEAYRIFTGKDANTLLMENGLKKNLDPEKVVIKEIRSRQDNLITDCKKADMLIDCRSLDTEQIRKIIDEEKSKAFNSQR